MLEFSINNIGNSNLKGNTVNYFGSVMVTHTKNDRQYFLSLPIGVAYEEANEAVLEMASAILEMKKQQEEAQKAKDAEIKASPTEAEIVS